MKRLVALSFALVLASPLPVAAHHSLSPYNRAMERSLEGTVKAIEWSNPHVRIMLLVPTADGAKQWEFEGGSVGRLGSSGYVKGAIELGDKITVKYNPRRDGSIGGFFTGIVTADGKAYHTRGFGTLDDPSARNVIPRDGRL
jgi:hypothetical protein